MCQTKMKTKCKICLTGHNYNFQPFRMALKNTYSNCKSILFNNNTIHLEVVPHMSLTTCYLMKATCMHVLMYAHVYNLRFSGKSQRNTNYFLSDISCGFLSDKSSFVGHILRFFGHFCRTHLAADTSGYVGHI